MNETLTRFGRINPVPTEEQPWIEFWTDGLHKWREQGAVPLNAKREDPNWRRVASEIFQVKLPDET